MIWLTRWEKIHIPQMNTYQGPFLTKAQILTHKDRPAENESHCSESRTLQERTVVSDLPKRRFLICVRTKTMPRQKSLLNYGATNIISPRSWNSVDHLHTHLLSLYPSWKGITVEASTLLSEHFSTLMFYVPVKNILLSNMLLSRNHEKLPEGPTLKTHCGSPACSHQETHGQRPM